MKQVVLTVLLSFMAAMCYAQGGAETTATDTSPLKQAEALVDKEVAAMKKLAPKNKRKGFNAQMTKGLADTLGKDQAQKKQLEDLVSKLSADDKAKLENYAKAVAGSTPKIENPNPRRVVMMANDAGAVRSWCDTYRGRPDMDTYCTGVVKWCWDVCILPDTSKKYYMGPYVCGVCLVFPF